MIYLITNTVNGKQYIGKTTRTMEVRWYFHLDAAKRGSQTHLHRAIRKHGADAFLVEYLADGLDDEEIIMIERHMPAYNMTRGGDGGDTSASPNFKAALARRKTRAGANNPNYGKKGECSPNYGKTRTPEQIENYRAGYRGKRIPVQVNGVQYDSVIGAARALNRSERYIRLHDELNEWKY
jgi:group I intron endonuclease